MPDLLLGCGFNRDRRINIGGRTEWNDLVTADCNKECGPDRVWDGTNPTKWGQFEDEEFDEVHAYEVLEHLGPQGDFWLFFHQFSEIWRILKPGGHFAATVPSRDSPWAWGDPSHTRIILPETLTFLIQPEYTKQVGKTSMSDFRDIYKADFDPVYIKNEAGTFCFVLKAIKPSRITK